MAFPLAVGVGRSVPSLIQVVVNHGDTTCSGLAYFGLVRREFDRGGIFPFFPLHRRHTGACTADFAVNMHCRLPLHSMSQKAEEEADRLAEEKEEFIVKEVCKRYGLELAA